MDYCRCDECRAANSRYEKHRRSWLGEFPKRKPPLVDAAPVVEHVEGLRDRGMGLKRIADKAGVAASAIGNVVYGRGGSEPRAATQMYRETAEKILAVELDLANGAKVDATEAWQIIDELVERGWSKAEIGRRLHGPSAVSLQLSESQIFAGNLRALRRLQYEPTPERVHNPTGQTYQPNPDRRHKYIAPSTPGVPDEALPRAHWLAVMRRGLREALKASTEDHGKVYV